MIHYRFRQFTSQKGHAMSAARPIPRSVAMQLLLDCTPAQIKGRFDQRVEELKTARRLSHNAAVSALMREEPGLHAAYVASGNHRSKWDKILASYT